MDFPAGVYLSEVQNPTHTVYLSTVILIVYLFNQGRGGELNQREGYWGNFHKAVSKIPT